MLDDTDEFIDIFSQGWTWVWSKDKFPKLCLYPTHDVDNAGYKRATQEEVHNGGYRLKEGATTISPTSSVDPASWNFDWRLRVA